MRFPRLSHLFHRRAKSDPELSRHASAPIATPATRPVSTSYLPDAPAPSTSSELFTQPSFPFLFPAPPPGPPFYSRSAGEHVDRPGSIVSVLTHRIRDLEGALLQEREAHEAALEANAAFADEAAAMQAEIVQLRRELFSALAGGPSASSSAGSGDAHLQASESVLAENAALGAECARLREFIGLMLAAGESKPVAQAAYAQVLEGAEPESAFVAAIQRAVAQPGSVWRALLEPVVGVRTQEEYLAQVRCTLGARAQTQDWRKRAVFWKRAAREDGRHAETVTPSVSAMSAVVDVLPVERRERVEEMMGKLQAGELPLRVERAVAPPQEELEMVCEEAQVLQKSCEPEDEPAEVPASTSATSSSSAVGPSDVHATVDANINMEESTSAPSEIRLPANSSSMVLPATLSMSTTRLSSAHSNLPPLASETFRASHSIKTLSSRGSRRSALGMHMVTSPTGDSFAEARESGKRISPSASASTQNSTKSRRRHAKIVAVPFAQSGSAAASGGALAALVENTSRWSFFGPSRSTTSAASVAWKDANAEVLPAESTSRASLAAAESEQLSPARSDSSDDPPSFELSVDTVLDDAAPRTPNRLSRPSLPKELLDFGSSPGDDLVLVLHSDFSGSSYRASPVQTTPEKRSRLPVRMPGLKAIKRFSASIAISRPVLVETTNAATFGFSQAAAPQVGAAMGGDEKARARAPSAAGRVVPGASPPRPSKIPMGRRLHKFGLSAQA